jgi:glycosyltransferase involved in cell wall biosynthesis
VARRCYRDSVAASAVAAAMIGVNRIRGTWKRDVDAFIALTRYSRNKFIQGGIAAGRIFVKPNFVEDPGAALRRPSDSRTILYAGRLSVEKGVSTLLRAWEAVNERNHMRLLIVGDGPDRAALEQQATRPGLAGSGVELAGARNRCEVLSLLREVRAVVVPSIWYENFPMIIAESFACGRPVITTDLGALGEIVRNNDCGLTFPAGDHEVLASILTRIAAEDHTVDRLGANARREYLSRYTPQANFECLMGIYRAALESRNRPLPDPVRESVKAACSSRTSADGADLHTIRESGRSLKAAPQQAADRPPVKDTR